MILQHKNYIHLLFEFIALIFSIPIFYIGLQQTNIYYKYFLIIFSILSFFVDGSLILLYFMYWS